jgi:hypothetical protein
VRCFYRAAIGLSCLGSSLVINAQDGRSQDIENASIQVLRLDPAKTLEVTWRDKAIPKPVLESPLIFFGNSSLVATVTRYSWICRRPPSDQASVGETLALSCRGVLLPESMLHGESLGADDIKFKGADWDRNYLGAMGGVCIRGCDSANPRAFLIAHGENKNEYIDGKWIQNTVMPSVAAKTCFSGYSDGTYKDCWQTYSGFIGALNVSIGDNGNIQDLKNYGPIIWPSAGYLDGHQHRVSHGVRHPSTFVYDGYLYIFYIDTSDASPSDPSRAGGVKLARMAIPENDVRPIALPYWDGQFSDTNRSVPGDLDSDAVKALATPGGKATSLWPQSSGVVKFAVAPTPNSKQSLVPTFLGVSEELGKDNRDRIYLRASHDLEHWSEPTLMKAATESGWQGGDLHYPEILAIKNTQNSENTLELTVAGSHAGSVELQDVEIKLKEPTH